MSSIIYGKGTIGRKPCPVVWQETTFGDMLIYDIPKDCDVIILCESNNSGMKPRRVLLPHQVYRKTIEEYGNDVVLVPVNCEEYVHVKAGN